MKISLPVAAIGIACGLIPSLLAGCGRQSPATAQPRSERPSAANQREASPVAPAPGNSVAGAIEAQEPPEARRLWDLYERWQMSRSVATLQQGLRELHEELPELVLSSHGDSLHWNTFQLPQFPHAGQSARESFNAFRFRSPLKQPADLYWTFAVPEWAGNWYIVPLSGSMEGFQSFRTLRNLELPDLKLPPGNQVVFQELTGGRILPAQDYVIWYRPPKDDAGIFHAALQLVPAGTHSPTESAAEIARILNLPIRNQEFPATAAGVTTSMNVAERLVRGSRTSAVALGAVLKSVASLLPEIRVSGADPGPVWNHVTPDFSFRFHAVRFRSPLQVPADLLSCLVVESDKINWGVCPLEGDLPHLDPYRLEVDCPIRGISVGSHNLAMFQTSSSGVIQPDQDYLLWFYPLRGALPEIDVCLRVVPARQSPPPVAAAEIAAEMGIEIPLTPTPERVEAAFRRCQEVMSDRLGTSDELRKYLQFADPALPVFPTGAGELEWTAVALQKESHPFVAYRVPVKGGAESIAAAVVLPERDRVAWGLIDPWYSDTYGNYEKWITNHSRNDGTAWEGVSLPAGSRIEFDMHNQPNPERTGPLYLIFSLAYGEHTSLQAAMRVLTREQSSRNYARSEVPRFLGFKIPERGSPGGVIARLETEVEFVDFLGQSRQFVTHANDNVFRILDATDRSQVRQIGPLPYSMIYQAVAADGKSMAVARGDNSISVIDLEQMLVLREIPMPSDGPGRIQHMALSPDGKILVATFFDQFGKLPDQIVRWNVDRPEETLEQDVPDMSIQDAGWLLQADLLMTCGYAPIDDANRSINYEGLVRYLDPATLEVRHEVRTPHAMWGDLAIARNGRRYATLNKLLGIVTVWDSASRETVAHLADVTFEPRLALSPDGARLLARGPERQISLWDVETQRVLQSWPAERQHVVAFDFAPDGRSIAAGGKDGTIRVFDLPEAFPDPELPPRETISNSLGMQLVKIPSGEFEMGVPEDQKALSSYRQNREDERPEHHVRITRPFYLGAHEVTVGQFRRFVEAVGYRSTAETSGKGGHHLVTAKGSEQRPEFIWRSPGFPQGDEHPVVQVSWLDATEFCKWLSRKEGRTYRLPSEAEWEYACRAGSTARWSFGDHYYAIIHYANVADMECRKHYGQYGTAMMATDGHPLTAPVGSYRPNAFGLYDMHGNVWEWCLDRYDAVAYEYSPIEDPRGARSGKNYVQRGGAMLYHAEDSRSGNRDFGPADQTQSSLGFRVVCELP